MKKWIVVVEKKSGRKEKRLVPARNKSTAQSNCERNGGKVLSCVPYAGQKVEVSGQHDDKDYKFGYGFGYEERNWMRRKGERR